MAILSREEYFNRLQDYIGEDSSDKAITLVEDMTDTYNSFADRKDDGDEWKKKYEENDRSKEKQEREQQIKQRRCAEAEARALVVSAAFDVLSKWKNNAIATPDAESIKEIGNIIMDYPALQNEFLNVLINRIGKVIITSKMFANPWAAFKQGILNYGETIEEIYVNLIKSFQFDPGVAESEVFKREKPDVRSAFHILNYKKFYKVTIEQEQLRQAFLSFDGINNLVTKIIEQIYTSANYDEFNVMKYMVGKMLLNGRLYPVTVPQVTTANMRSIVSKIKGTSNRFEFMSSAYNVAGVANHALKENQYLLVSSAFDAEADVEVLAMAFKPV